MSELFALLADEDSLIKGGSLVVLIIIAAIVLAVWQPWHKDGD